MTPKAHSVTVTCHDCPTHWPAHAYINTHGHLTLEPATSRCPACKGAPRLVLLDTEDLRWRQAA